MASRLDRKIRKPAIIAEKKKRKPKTKLEKSANQGAQDTKPKNRSF